MDSTADATVLGDDIARFGQTAHASRSVGMGNSVYARNRTMRYESDPNSSTSDQQQAPSIVSLTA
jgi:hypothetical protein